jgi:hypothetical protein
MLRSVFLILVAASQVTGVSAAIINGNFATGDFTGWSTLDVSPALGAGLAVQSFSEGNRAVLTAAPTSTSTATAAIQQTFLVPSAARLTFDVSSDQSIAGLAEGLAGTSQVSIAVSELGGSGGDQFWMFTLYNNPAFSPSSLSNPFQTVSMLLPEGGTYNFYAQVQAADGQQGNGAFAQMTLTNLRLSDVPNSPEPGTLILGLAGLVTCLGIVVARRVRAA